MVLPQDLKKQSFSKAFSGYSTSEVEEYIGYLKSKYSEACAEYAELERKYKLALERLDVAKSEENTISATIVNAQKMADAIVADAKEKANSIRDAVSDSCDRILSAYAAKASAERDKLERTEKAVAEFKNSLYDAYKRHISLIDDIMPDDDTTPVLSDEELKQKAVELAKDSMNKLENGEIQIPDLSHQKDGGDNNSDEAQSSDKDN